MTAQQYENFPNTTINFFKKHLMEIKRKLKEVVITMDDHQLFELSDLMDLAEKKIKEWNFDKNNTLLGLEKTEWEIRLLTFDRILE